MMEIWEIQGYCHFGPRDTATWSKKQTWLDSTMKTQIDRHWRFGKNNIMFGQGYYSFHTTVFPSVCGQILLIITILHPKYWQNIRKLWPLSSFFEITWVCLRIHKPKNLPVHHHFPHSDYHLLEPHVPDLALRASLLSRHFCASACGIAENGCTFLMWKADLFWKLPLGKFT